MYYTFPVDSGRNSANLLHITRQCCDQANVFNTMFVARPSASQYRNYNRPIWSSALVVLKRGSSNGRRCLTGLDNLSDIQYSYCERKPLKSSTWKYVNNHDCSDQPLYNHSILNSFQWEVINMTMIIEGSSPFVLLIFAMRSDYCRWSLKCL